MSDFLKVGGPIPVNAGRCVDLYHDVRTLRLAMQKEVEEMAKREAELREHLIQTLARSDGGGAVGLRYMARKVTKTAYQFAKPQTDANEAEIPGTTGWGLFTSWVRKNNAFHFLQKRLANGAVKEMWEQERRLPPGITSLEVPEISVTKV